MTAALLLPSRRQASNNFMKHRFGPIRFKRVKAISAYRRETAASDCSNSPARTIKSLVEMNTRVMYNVIIGKPIGRLDGLTSAVDCLLGDVDFP